MLWFWVKQQQKENFEGWDKPKQYKNFKKYSIYSLNTIDI